MKLSLVIASVVAMSSLATMVGNTEVKATEKVKTVQIVTEHGFKVLKDNDTSKSTVACKITKFTKDEVTCKNLFDGADVLNLEQNEVKKDWKKGDNILVTFTGDWVTKTMKNNKKLVYTVNVQ